MRQLRDDAAYLARKPFRLDRRGQRKALAIAGSTLALYLVRDKIRDFIQDHPSDTLSDWANGARDVVGKGAFAPALALAFYGASVATGSEREKETAFLLLESMAWSAAAAAVGSFVLAAERPADGDSVRLFDPEGHGVSLDVALAASVISPLRRQYLRVRPGDGPGRRFWKRLATGALYAGAGLTAYQRMDADRHWAPDVFLGLVTGLEVGRALGESHDRSAARTATLTLGLVPRGAGLRVVLELGRR